MSFVNEMCYFRSSGSSTVGGLGGTNPQGTLAVLLLVIMGSLRLFDLGGFFLGGLFGPNSSQLRAWV